MARLAGFGGEVQIGTVAQTGIREWSMDYTVAVLDGRGFDDGQLPHPVMGAIEWGGSFRGPKDGAPITPFTAVALVLQESTTTGQSWTGSAFVTGVHDNVGVDGLIEYSYDFVGKGTLTIATA